MSALFTLPEQTPLSSGAVLPGAKLYFFQTGTTTPQNTYQDNARATPHANPVVADAAGTFPAIYLDPTLPDYRARLTTSADVQLEQWDGVPSNQNTQQSIRLESTLPSLSWYDTDGTTNQRKYRAIASGNTWKLQSLNDAESTIEDVLVIKNDTVRRMVLPSITTVDTGSVEYPVAYTVTGSFTGTLTGMTGATTVTVKYLKNGSLVHLYIESGTTGTSNSITFAMTGLPAAVTPTSTKVVPCSSIIDNGNSLVGLATVTGGANSISFSLLRTGTIANRVDYSGSIFTGSGNKGLFDGWSITYAI